MKIGYWLKVKKVEELQVTKLIFKHMVTEDNCVRDGYVTKEGNYSSEKALITLFSTFVFEVVTGQQGGEVAQWRSGTANVDLKTISPLS